METGSSLFSKFIKNDRLPRFMFMPLIGDLAAKVGGLSYREMCMDPTQWANSLMKTADLFDLDGVVAGFDFSIMAEACGSEITWDNDQPRITAPPGALNPTPEDNVRLKTVIETARRLFQVCHNQRVCIAAMTGPITLAYQLFGMNDYVNRINEAKQIVARITEMFCQCKPDILLYMEEKPLALAAPAPTFIRAYNTLKNEASYYNIVPALYIEGYAPNTLAAFSAMKMNLNIPGPSANGELPLPSALWDLNMNASGIALSVPVDDIDKAREIIQQGIDFHLKKGKQGFYTSYGPLAASTHLETVHQLVKEIKNTRL